jgi:rare lipoprotein A
MLLILVSFCGYISRKGLASYYSDYYEGKTTANGEIFRHNKVTAAHKSLPFGTRVKVINLKNNKSVVVRINDRGPFIKGRIIDLTKTAAKEIGMLGDGVAKVKIRYK